jgi:predicted DNA-binding ribbon-helix-helix protein
MSGEAMNGALTPGIVKRSLVIAGHSTSISLEGPFWNGLKALARARRISLAALVAEIDAGRRGGNLSSAIRLHVLEAAIAGRLTAD